MQVLSHSSTSTMQHADMRPRVGLHDACPLREVVHTQVVCHGHHHYKEEPGPAGEAFNVIFLQKAALCGHGAPEDGGNLERGVHTHRAGRSQPLQETVHYRDGSAVATHGGNCSH